MTLGNIGRSCGKSAKSEIELNDLLMDCYKITKEEARRIQKNDPDLFKKAVKVVGRYSRGHYGEICYFDKHFSKELENLNKEIPIKICPEKSLVDYSGALWNEFIKLPNIHPDDLTDFRKCIHDMQRILLARIARNDS